MENGKLKFLIAEDDFIMAMGIKQKVEELGFDVVSLVSTGLEAITRSVLDKPDIILMDILLSGSLDGVEAAKIISYKCSAPVIFLVDHSSLSTIEAKKPEAGHSVLHKPVTAASLKEVIHEVRYPSNFQKAGSASISKTRRYPY